MSVSSLVRKKLRLFLLVLLPVWGGCIGLLYTPTRGIGTITAGVHTNISLQVSLPKRAHSWEVGLWPVSGSSTNLGGLIGEHLTVRVTNLTKDDLVISNGVPMTNEVHFIVTPGKTSTLFEGTLSRVAQFHCLFGCNTHLHGVSFRLEIDFSPAIDLHESVQIAARGRDAI